jgi:hypothetical protein
MTEFDIDVSITLAESRAYQGDDSGINFSISAVSTGGRIVGDLIPENYSPGVWVSLRKPQEIAARWQAVEDSNMEAFVPLIQKHAEEVSKE